MNLTTSCNSLFIIIIFIANCYPNIIYVKVSKIKEDSRQSETHVKKEQRSTICCGLHCRHGLITNQYVLLLGLVFNAHLSLFWDFVTSFSSQSVQKMHLFHKITKSQRRSWSRQLLLTSRSGRYITLSLAKGNYYFTLPFM